MNNCERLRKMSDIEVQGVWDAIMEMNSFDRADLDVEWQEDVYSEISIRGLRSRVRTVAEGRPYE